MANRPLPERILCLVTDMALAGGEKPLLECIDAAVGGGVNMVQVRAHELDEAELTRIAAAIVDIVSGRALTIVNGPVEAAMRAGADGVHFPESSTLAGAERKRGLVTGRSVHSVESAVKAASRGADYLVLGTIFPSRSHPDGQTGGTELVRAVSEAVPAPLIGIGGITAGNATDVVRAGACGVAVISAIIGESDPARAARRLADAIGI